MHLGRKNIVQLVVEQLNVVEHVVRPLRTILGLGIVPHLFQFHQPIPGELNVERKPLFRLPTGISNLVDLCLRQRFAMPLRLHEGRTR